jgi:hypothetical protein
MQKLKHIPHLEEFGTAYDRIAVLCELVDWINTPPVQRAKHNIINGVMTKYDGAPSIVFGYLDDRFFVASKAIWNKTPKINFTHKDIQKNHHTNPALQAKLLWSFDYLRETFKREQGIYQGDVLWTAVTRSNGTKSFSFTPNTLTYKLDSSDPIYDDVFLSYVGVYVHTSYEGDKIENLKANYTPYIPLMHSKHVYLQKWNDFPLAEKEFSMKPLEDFWNHSEQNKTRQDHLAWLTNFKHAIIDTLAPHVEPFSTFYEGDPTGPEGFVVVYKGQPVKLINKNEFTNYNNRKWGRA